MLEIVRAADAFTTVPPKSPSEHHEQDKIQKTTTVVISKHTLDTNPTTPTTPAAPLPIAATESATAVAAPVAAQQQQQQQTNNLTQQQQQQHRVCSWTHVFVSVKCICNCICVYCVCVCTFRACLCVNLYLCLTSLNVCLSFWFNSHTHAHTHTPQTDCCASQENHNNLQRTPNSSLVSFTLFLTYLFIFYFISRLSQ